METILSKALPEITEEAQPDEIETDWLVHFFDKCRLISDDDMQALWAQVLAGQANSPGTYSKRTVDILAALEKSDAVMFSRLGCFCIITPTLIVVLVIYEPTHQIYTQQGIHFESLANFESLGLLQFSGTGGYELDKTPQMVSYIYLDVKLELEFPMSINKFDVGKVMLTRADQELIRLSEAGPVIGFTDYLAQQWRKSGIKVKIVPEEPNNESE